MMNAMTQDTSAERRAWRNTLRRKVCSRNDFANNAQYVHTPYDLCHEMVERLDQYGSLHTAQTFLTFNLEFVETLCYSMGIEKSKIWFVTECLEKAAIARFHPRYSGINVIYAEYLLTWNTNNMKFDVIAGNPPYQDGTGATGIGHTLWDQFVEKSLSLLSEGGHLCYVHPAGWRDSDGQFKDTQKLIKSKKVKYLEIHDRADGVRTFGVQTAYDWYILQNVKSEGKTIVKSQSGETCEIDLNGMEFIPNSMFKAIQSLMATDGESRVEVIRSESAYEIRKPHMSREKNEKHQYPCVYTVLRDGTINLFYSSTKGRGHFGIPKVIFTNGTSLPIVDDKGKYGLTQFAYGIVDTPENLSLIQKAMMTERFIAIMNECQLVGKHRYARKAISLFKKDFWKQFVDENGNELK